VKNKTALLRELCDVRIGRTPSRDRPDFWRGPNAWVSIADINEAVVRQTKEGITDLAIHESGCQPVEPGTLLLSFKLSLGKVAFAGTRLFTNEAIAALPIRDPDQIDNRYLYYRLHSMDWASLGRRAVKGNCLNKEILEEAEIVYPDLFEQRRIAERLEQADRLRRTRRYAPELTDTFLPAAFLELFGDPIENPHRFRVEPLEDLIQRTRPISYGILMPGPDVPTGVPYIRVTDIQNGQVVTALVRRTTREIDQAYKRSKLKAGDLLLSIRGHVGRMAIVPPCLDGANITQDTARLATVDTLESHYLMGCLASRGMQHRMVRLTRGAAVQGINLGDVKELPIPVPPLPLQQKFAALVERVERLRAVQREALRQAEHLFASLLHGAFSG
jgi:type I restriction enzyme, S subunit